MSGRDAATSNRSAPGAERPVVATILGYYLPGWKAGGQTTTAALAVERLSGDFDFRVFCVDRDLGDRVSYPGVNQGTWNTIGSARVCYLSASRLTTWWREPAARQLPYDIIWLHGMFARASIATLAHRRVAGRGRVPAVIVPHGELSRGALGIKAGRKAAYLRMARHLGLFADLWWQVSTPEEADEVTRAFPRVPSPRIRVVRNLAAPGTLVADPVAEARRRPKIPGQVRLVFLSRITRKKNLDIAIRLLSEVEGDVVFDVYGPIEDVTYWAECQSATARLPATVRVTYRGALEPAGVLHVLSSYHGLLFPTRGENFGYVVLEALQSGCLPLISTATPWNGLEAATAGWDIPLSEPIRFVAALRHIASMDDPEFAAWSKSAVDLGRAAAENPEPPLHLRQLLSDALQH